MPLQRFTRHTCSFLFSTLFFLPAALLSQEQYPVHPDSLVQEGVPQGKVSETYQWKSKVFPGTVRDYAIYVPRQYDPKKPACVLIAQDGVGLARRWKIPTVMDNLIHKKEMPVTIGIFISPGVIPAPHKDAQPRFNRSFEYDGLGDRYARFLLEEILPEVSKQYNLSKDPNDRMITGSSSGAICAFTAAWERPDQFRRVFTSVGTFVSLRGGNEYPTLVRKYEPRPIRICMQDGSNDNNLYAGGWWEANLDMYASLKFAGYDVKNIWGTGGHNNKHATAILPDAMKWLWRDYPAPITNVAGKKRRTDILIPGQTWQRVSQGHKFTEGPAVDDQGNVYFTDIPNNRIHKIDLADKVTLFAENTQGANGLMMGPDGKLYACANGAQQIVRYGQDGLSEVVVKDITSNDLILTPTGGYATDPTADKIWHFTYDGKKTEVASKLGFPNGLHTTTDHAFLLVTNTKGRFNIGFQIQGDGRLANRQPYGHLHRGNADNDTGADGVTIDTAGRLYCTTRMGVQILDQLGRVHLILEKPSRGWLSNAVFGGAKLDTLYVTCGTEVYKRKLKATGVRPWKAPLKAGRPNL